MTSKEKRVKIVSDVIKPLLKENGYKHYKSTWYSQREDCYLVIHMYNSLLNSDVTGIQFRLHIDALSQSEIKNIENIKRWISSNSMIYEYAFLPNWGLLHEYRNSLLGYKIDGYRNYKPLNMNVEDIAFQIEVDFKEFILPKLQKIYTMKEWEQLKDDLQMRTYTKEIALLLFYENANKLAIAESNKIHLIKFGYDKNLTADEIKENIAMLKKVQNIAETVCNNAEEFIMEVLNEY